jgi:hypothetical protein
MELVEGGQKLREYLFSLDVEHNWLQNQHVNWLSGKTINSSMIDPLDSFYTHCSSFVSSVCYQLNIPFLIPNTELGVRTEGLANKQHLWLKEYGNKNGWTEINKDNVMSEANMGYIIIATYHNYHNCNCGHIAIICPHKRSKQFEQSEQLEKEEIKICQAGMTNSSCMNISDAFTHHNNITYWIYKQ